MDAKQLSGALQENLLTLLCFDEHYAKMIRHSIQPTLFESAVFREIATQAIDFLDQFGNPIKEHLPDALEHILLDSDSRKAASYKRVLDNLFLAKDSVNGEYTISQLTKFIRQQNLKAAVVKAVEAIEDGNIDSAETELQRGLNSQVISFDRGLNLGDPKDALSFFDQQDQGFLFGIDELDKRDICPRPGEMLLFIAPPKRGKSWALIHAGKWGLLQRKKVLHITLEMAANRVSMRYVQSLFSVSKRDTLVRTAKLIKENGILTDIDYEDLERMSLRDPKAKAFLTTRLNKEFKRRPPLMIKQFPTGFLTISALEAYLDGLERFEKFTPDMVVLDYPDLMNLGSGDNLRVDTGRVYKELRGLAMQRHFALVVASQGNRLSSKAKVITDDMVAEDYSKIATADNVITYSQTEAEKKLGLARLFVSNGRNDEDKFTVLITQAYSIGQFCLDSCMLSNDYWLKVEDKSGTKKRKDSEDDDPE